MRHAFVRQRCLVCCAALGLLATACGLLGTEPSLGTEAGRYVATSLATAAGGRPLPALTDSSAEEFGVLLADTLELDGRGGARRAFAIRRANRTFGTDTVYRLAGSLAYRRAGKHVEIGSFTPCPANALCIGNDTGTVTADGLALTAPRFGGARLMLARVAP
jgi:hypothetical protein